MDDRLTVTSESNQSLLLVTSSSKQVAPSWKDIECSRFCVAAAIWSSLRSGRVADRVRSGRRIKAVRHSSEWHDLVHGSWRESICHRKYCSIDWKNNKALSGESKRSMGSCMRPHGPRVWHLKLLVYLVRSEDRKQDRTAEP